MVTQQDFISGLLEPLPAAMAPLAVADVPGAVARGMISGQSLPEAFGKVDPLSAEGRVHGEDITGGGGSGFLVDLLTDPMTLAGAGLGGLGMALSRRAFLKRAGRGATALAGAATGGEGLLKEVLKSGTPGRPPSYYLGTLKMKMGMMLELKWQHLNKKLAEAEEQMNIKLGAALKEHGPKALRSSEYWGREQVEILKEMGKTEASLAHLGLKLMDPAESAGLTGTRGEKLYGKFEVDPEYGTGMSSEMADARKAEVLEDFESEILDFKEGMRGEWRKKAKELSRGNWERPRKKAAISADEAILARLIREMSRGTIPGGRPRGY